ncbi:acyl-CoA thioesterase [Marinobacter maritimus]|jgi:acyl-CoA thioester hydrolase|uniref:acyl-CoA thioesterase n=1 Tax=Marinobacter maritimus TaxID=277961 RepID=UPI0011AB2863|nr:thioesterase family protein [Marinobacter maritimus]|tara:strand:- start:189 stop:632 length:444 start_codon:yes stop_codon:yes gene_type:complete
MAEGATKDWTLEQFPIRTYDKLRYADTDRQGHVNNAVFSTFLETGRVELIYDSEAPLASSDTSFVIVNINLQLRAEIHWPGTVDIGSAVTRVGNSSIQLHQGIFQNGVCCATAESVIVCIDNNTQKPTTLADAARRNLSRLETANKR